MLSCLYQLGGRGACTLWDARTAKVIHAFDMGDTVNQAKYVLGLGLDLSQRVKSHNFIAVLSLNVFIIYLFIYLYILLFFL